MIMFLARQVKKKSVFAYLLVLYVSNKRTKSTSRLFDPIKYMVISSKNHFYFKVIPDSQLMNERQTPTSPCNLNRSALGYARQN
ncbi:MAG: hypothetical protein BMS9Abin11_0913 [Gammaproteobacteria bacterium]|nr:MAG: hypothetical protein BMS9Abin11_0913 [Gammaproteobacteria bacterium]